LRSRLDGIGSRAGKRAGQLVAAVDSELAEHLSQVPLNRARAEEQPRADLRVRQAVARELSDLPLLRRQIIACFDGSPAGSLARRHQLATRALRERLHPHRREHVVCCAELLARVDPATLATQPLTVEQARTS
jgi:hypothetical protein